ncbi:MAG: hypothetical protein C0467_26740 [Planctomycetaceae bacterium]|nr:hypothetical protein [Planctomycetaceae bacterium]
MDRIKSRLLTAVAVLGFAATFASVGISLSNAQDSKVPDLSDLRDAVKAANKRGENVSEIATALTALEKAVAKGWTFPEGGRTLPASPELVALRDAVEAAGKKGENVEAIVKELELVEKAMTGQVLTRPKPLPPVDPPIRPNPNPFVRPDFGGFPRPNIRPGVNAEDIRKAQDLMRRAMEMRLKNPDDAEALKLLEEAREMMLKAIAGANGGGLIVPDLDFPNPGIGRIPDRARLGIRMERVTPILVEQLGLADGIGIVIVDVIDDSAAAKAGFKANDVLVEFGGKAVTDVPEDLSRRVNEARGKEKLDAVVIRKGKKVEIKGIELPELRQPFPRRDVQPRVLELDGVRKPAVGRGNSTSLTMNGDAFTIKAVRDGVVYKITGTKNNDGAALTEVTIDDDGKTHTTNQVDKVPDEYRPTVEKLLKSIQNGRVTVGD